MRLLNFLKSILRALRELLFGKPRSDTGNKLRDFLIDLSNCEELQDEFVEDPKGVMERYGLTEEEQRWICEGDTDAINKAIGEKYFSTLFIHISKS